MKTENNQNREWNVIKIFDEYRLLINAGREDGLKEDEELVVLGGGEQITDPVKGNYIGVLNVPKATVRVIHVQEKMAVVENTEFYEASTGLLGSYIPTKKHYLTKLPVDSADISGGWKKEKIKIGDVVKRKQDI